jgi:hypothetical protein
MQEKTVGFFTKESAEYWFFHLGDQVEVLAKKIRDPQGDGSPQVLIKMKIPDRLLNSFYPDGKVMDKEFEEYEGKPYS